MAVELLDDAVGVVLGSDDPGEGQRAVAQLAMPYDLVWYEGPAEDAEPPWATALTGWGVLIRWCEPRAVPGVVRRLSDRVEHVATVVRATHAVGGAYPRAPFREECASYHGLVFIRRSGGYGRRADVSAPGGWFRRALEVAGVSWARWAACAREMRVDLSLEDVPPWRTYWTAVVELAAQGITLDGVPALVTPEDLAIVAYGRRGGDLEAVARRLYVRLLLSRLTQDEAKNARRTTLPVYAPAPELGETTADACRRVIAALAPPGAWILAVGAGLGFREAVRQLPGPARAVVTLASALGAMVAEATYHPVDPGVPLPFRS